MDYLFIFIFCVDNDKGIELIMYFKKKKLIMINFKFEWWDFFFVIKINSLI